MVVGEGFEPSKSMTADLQSDPFGHSGTPPRGWQLLIASALALRAAAGSGAHHIKWTARVKSGMKNNSLFAGFLFGLLNCQTKQQPGRL